MANFSQRYAAGDSNTAGAFYFSTVAAVDYAATKLMFSADGVAPTHVSSADPLPVTVGNTVTVASHAVTNAGTFAVQVDGAALTSLQLIDDAVATTAAAIPAKGLAVSGTDGTNARVLKTDASGELQVDVLTMPTVAVTGTFFQATQPVSLASVPSHAVTNAGAFVVQVDGAALTALQLLDDVVATDGAAAPTKGLMLAGTDGTNAQTISVTTAGWLNTRALDNATDAVVVYFAQALPAGTNNIGDVDVLTVPADPFGANADAASATGSISAKLRSIASTGIPITGTVTVGSHAVTNAGTFAVQAAQSGTWTVQPGNTANTTPWLTEERAGTAGGLTKHKTISAATTNATSVKASAGKVYHIYCSNINAAVRYLKLYEKASAPTVGTDVPALTYLIPGNTAGAGFTINVPTGLEFTTGIAFALTTGVADADTGAVAASELVVNLGYK